VPGRELEPSIERSHKASVEKAMGLDHDRAGSATITMAVYLQKRGGGEGLLAIHSLAAAEDSLD
jgi:hypothetical protein